MGKRTVVPGADSKRTSRWRHWTDAQRIMCRVRNVVNICHYRLHTHDIPKPFTSLHALESPTKKLILQGLTAQKEPGLNQLMLRILLRVQKGIHCEVGRHTAAWTWIRRAVRVKAGGA
ncbi:unnamed protein product [Cyberlindnera jadinii]|uniref:Uncharacterized protein n=1 Tax=Cyberlindnera jadinii (strain ATCC 18201 / CBS 1600 / BCRC 20928 / JCM 3617 / NBRC 0987 / NRRL Y-1542) TaxID=983966 RepID=A0A0H5C759_CYBJN|nr:unnamed protein product [Cyberlindnera jadinii]